MSTERNRDTQWPRFEVFQQAREGAPFANVGSVHAPDAELALQNARDVFVRRPQTHRLWVAPARVILMKTAEELEADPSWSKALVTEDVPEKVYFIFRKTTQRRSMTYVSHVGAVKAVTPVQALAEAIEQFNDEPVYVWWIVPAEAIVANRDEDADSMFGP
ncbi:MAG: phenylacetic acid degradation protein, partial [Chloroflexota bacterium]